MRLRLLTALQRDFLIGFFRDETRFRATPNWSPKACRFPGSLRALAKHANDDAIFGLSPPPPYSALSDSLQRIHGYIRR